MKTIIKTGLFVMVLAALFAGQVNAEDLTSLNKADLLLTSASYKDGVLGISFFYRNRDEDRRVYWENERVKCICEVYENKGSYSDVKKGRTISRLEKTMNRADQRMFIDIHESFLGMDIVVECNVNTRYEHLFSSDKTSVR